jgi:predicted DNA-binding transcriptional regulator AlpA
MEKTAMPQIIAQPDLAEMLGRSLSTLRYWRHNGYGPRSFLLGGRVCYKVEDVEAWLEQQYNDDTAGQRVG